MTGRDLGWETRAVQRKLIFRSQENKKKQKLNKLAKDLDDSYPITLGDGCAGIYSEIRLSGEYSITLITVLALVGYV